MKIKRSIAVLLVLAIIVLTVGCASTPSTESSDQTSTEPSIEVSTEPSVEESTESGDSSTDGEKFKLGLSISTMTTFCTLLTNAAQEECDKLGIELQVINANNNMESQINAIETFTSQKVDMIMLLAADANALNDAITKAKDAGIPTINVNARVTSEDIVGYVGSDDVDAGRMQGEWLAEVTGGTAKVCILVGDPANTASSGRIQGREEAFFNVYPGVEVLDTQIAGWTRDKAMSITEDWLQRFSDITVIVADNDDMALGAAAAVKAAGRKDEILIVGVDAIEDAVKAVQNGDMDMTVFQDAAGQGKAVVDTAYDCLINNITKLTSDVLIPFQPVTIDNVDQYIAD